MGSRNFNDLRIYFWYRESYFPKLQSFRTPIWLCRDWLLFGMEQITFKTQLTKNGTII
jgi:hypothetical protein